MITTDLTNIYDAAVRGAQAYGDRTFLVIGRREEAVTFREFAAAADLCGRRLWALGLRPGQRVALWMTNRVDWAVAAFGVARCGAILAPVNTRLSSREVAHFLALTRASFWILEDRFIDKVDAAGRIGQVLEELTQRKAEMPTIIVRASDGVRYPGLHDWRELMTSQVDDGAPLPLSAELASIPLAEAGQDLTGVAAILSTSGTTSAPKGVMLTHCGLLRLAAAIGERQKLGPGKSFYSIGPFFHCAGFVHGLLTTLLAGATYFSPRRLDTAEVWDVLTSESVTTYHGFIGPLQEVAALPQFDLGKLSHLDGAWYSAPAADMARLEAEYGAPMCEVYGLTETGGNVSICTVDDPVEMRHDSDGRPHEGLEVRIVDPMTGQSVDDGTPGEIQVRGWNVMRGYIADVAATERAVDRDGWLRTGDQGVRLPGGFIKFLSRMKDIIRVGGENLSPMEVEEVLIGHADVAEAAVVAAPDRRLGEVPVAFLIARKGATLDHDELKEFCRARLAGFKVPRQFIVVDDFPRTGATMRVQKVMLKERLNAESVNEDSGRVKS